MQLFFLLFEWRIVLFRQWDADVLYCMTLIVYGGFLGFRKMRQNWMACACLS